MQAPSVQAPSEQAPSEHDGCVETQDTATDDTAEAAPPGWVLRTPVRLDEVWTVPALTLLLAAVEVLGGVAFGGAFALVVGVSAGVLTTAGAVALFVTSWRAYDEQTVEASWRAHVTHVVAGVTIGGVAAVATLLVGLSFGALFGAMALPLALRSARAVPRFDHLAVMWAFGVVGAICATLAVIGLTIEDVPRIQRGSWVAGGVLAVFSALVVVHQFRAAARAPRR